MLLVLINELDNQKKVGFRLSFDIIVSAQGKPHA